jgi:hypothetical protein
MEIISKPAGGNKRSSYIYTHTRNRLPSHCKRVGATATDGWLPSHCKRVGATATDGCGPKNIRDKACPYWLAGNCKHAGDDCKYLHSHVIGGSDVTFLTKLVGHDNKVRLAQAWFVPCFLSCQIIVGFLIFSAYSSSIHGPGLIMKDDLTLAYFRPTAYSRDCFSFPFRHW